jgi:hypothetical protein
VSHVKRQVKHLRPRVVLALTLGVAAIGCLAWWTTRGDGAPGTPEHRYAIRGVYGRDGSSTGFEHQARLGFNVIDSGPYPQQMTALQAGGLKALVWLGGYSNDACSFRRSDAWVRSHVAAIAGDTAVAAYFIDDEPDAARCPGAPRAIRARASLVKSLDPRPPTLIVTYHTDQLARLAGTVDVIGLDHYPCSNAHGCEFSVINEQTAVADRLGIRYWGVIQAHGDDWYRLPSQQEIHDEFLYWRATNMEGYLVFAWRWPPERPDLWLANHPELQAQLAKENARSQ